MAWRSVADFSAALTVRNPQRQPTLGIALRRSQTRKLLCHLRTVQQFFAISAQIVAGRSCRISPVSHETPPQNTIESYWIKTIFHGEIHAFSGPLPVGRVVRRMQNFTRRIRNGETSAGR